ncbi:ABC transporter, partial [bacterium]|nr:ABC transporter [bacterium]
MMGAGLALTVAAGTVLGLGQGMRVLVDAGFSAGDAAVLDRALLVLLGVIALMAGATYGRFFLVSWIGERVVADIRRAVYDHVLRLSPGYFETTKTGEILSRLTNDTTLL